MIAGHNSFAGVMDLLKSKPRLSIDTETTSLRSFHGGRLFSIIIGTEDSEYYFNFQDKPDIPLRYQLGTLEMRQLQTLFDNPSTYWFLFNAKFDMHFLATESLEIKGTIHCCQSMARLIYNDYMTYSLKDCAGRIGLVKDDSVDKYITEHKLYDSHSIPGKKSKEKILHFDQVPWEIITKYALQDARITYDLGVYQEAEIAKIDSDTQPGLPLLSTLAANERLLTKTVFRMERLGARVDKDYCVRAAQFETGRADSAKQAFKELTQRDFIPSGKLFSEVFLVDKHLWSYTEKGNPSFDADALEKLTHPAAKEVLKYNDAKAKANFYHSFLYYADENDCIHTNFNPAGTVSGRFSSNSVNLQNIKKDEGESLSEEFVVRRAFIPHPGHILVMLDFDQVEYRVLLDYAKEMGLIEKIKSGLDVHLATAQMMGVDRRTAKTINFALLYGAGVKKLAASLSVGEGHARSLRTKYFSALPRVTDWVSQVIHAAKIRGSIRNWYGRRLHIPADFAFIAPNHLIQSSCADIAKIAMNRVDAYLADKKSKMILCVHDELVLSVEPSEKDEVVTEVKRIMETSYPHRLLPLTVGVEWSDISLADKKEGFP